MNTYTSKPIYAIESGRILHEVGRIIAMCIGTIKMTVEFSESEETYTTSFVITLECPVEEELALLVKAIKAEEELYFVRPGD